MSGKSKSSYTDKRFLKKIMDTRWLLGYVFHYIIIIRACDNCRFFTHHILIIRNKKYLRNKKSTENPKNETVNSNYFICLD